MPSPTAVLSLGPDDYGGAPGGPRNARSRFGAGRLVVTYLPVDQHGRVTSDAVSKGLCGQIPLSCQ